MKKWNLIHFSYISNKIINNIKMSDKGNDNGYDSCQHYTDLADTISDQRDDCTNSACAAATDISAAIDYFTASACYSSKK